MKKIKLLFLIAAVFSLSACSDWLELEPKDQISGTTLFSSQEGRNLYLANLYYQLPMEDFGHSPGRYNASRGSFNTYGNQGGWVLAFMSDEAYHSEKDGNTDQWNANFRTSDRWWAPGYILINNVNLYLEELDKVSFADLAEKNNAIGEAHFIRAFAYFALAKRYGGVSIIEESQAFTTDWVSLRVPRSTEKATWQYVLDECDRAITLLADNTNNRKANKWTAYALKSRAALFAGTLALHYDDDPLADEAASLGLKGLAIADANAFLGACIDASAAIITSGKWSLYGATPASITAATTNLKNLFEDVNVAPTEVMLIKGYTAQRSGYSHNYQSWYEPYQTRGGSTWPGRLGPLLDLVEQYESIDGTPGYPTRLKTIAGVGDGKTTPTDYDNAAYNQRGFQSAAGYYEYYTNPEDLFTSANKDARFRTTVIWPGQTWGGTKIVIKAGNIKADGTEQITQDDGAYVESDYVTPGTQVRYYGFGNIGTFNKEAFSGFRIADAGYSRSGFSFRKFSVEAVRPTASENRCTNDWPEFRYAEILLNYAEAALSRPTAVPAEVTNALTYVNQIRKRAGLSVEIPAGVFNLEMVLRERRVELAFENKRFWDMKRLRIFTTKYQGYRAVALKPVQDFRPGNVGKWIFIRDIADGAYTYTWVPENYYLNIDGVDGNGVIEN